ncbi:MAG: hypothetical protein Tsb005_10300 [Gammaproteobacteria bacterium]
MQMIWQNLEDWQNSILSPSLADWLTHKESMTRRVYELTGYTFRVALRCHTWQSPRMYEAELLQIDTQQLALVREVDLFCSHETWMYARAVFSAAFVRQVPALRDLGTQPLGQILFQYPVQRSDFEICLLEPTNAMYPLATRALSNSIEPVWARRSCLKINDATMLLTEFFLPDMIHAIEV